MLDIICLRKISHIILLFFGILINLIILSFINKWVKNDVGERFVALEGLIVKIDTDTAYQPDGPNWPSLLDSFSLIAGQIATLTKYLQNEKTPELRDTSCYPLFLNPERDEAIFRITEGRVPCVNHEVVPDYFRTKPDPAVEAEKKKMEEAAASLTPDAAQVEINCGFIRTHNRSCTVFA